MLILSRKLDEAISLPHLGVEIVVTEIRGNRVCLGVNAPPDVLVLRSELMEGDQANDADDDE